MLDCSPWLKMFIPDAFPNSNYHLRFTEGDGDAAEGKVPVQWVAVSYQILA